MKDKKWLFLSLLGIIAILLITIIILILYIIKINKVEEEEMIQIDLQEIYDEIGCNSIYCEVSNDGSYLQIDTNPYDIDDYSSYIAIGLVEDANTALGFTEALYTMMGQTRALDGTLTESNETIKASWTYHPDNGLVVIYSVINPEQIKNDDIY